jgi:glycosyltransferase involved in cell wall biosynthesis
MARNPPVSIVCITYQHAAYLRRALDGFMAQRYDGPLEIIIHDDASTDGTQDIIQAFAREHPGLVVPILQQENQLSRGRMAWGPCFERATGKYLAFCEGDDHWTDPGKLTKQVEWMEAHPEVVLTWHDARMVAEDGRTLRGWKVPERHRRDVTGMQLRRGESSVTTLSMVVRNIPMLRALPHEFHRVRNSDNFLTMLLGEHGGGHFMPEVEAAVYVVHQGGIWSSKDRTQRKLEQLNTWMWMAAYQDRMGDVELAQHFIGKANATMKRLASHHRLKTDPLYRAMARLVRLFGKQWPR